VSDLQFQLVAALVKVVLVVAVLVQAVPVMTWIERRVCGLIQDRWGPNRVGPWGLLQPLADGIKFVMKEDIMPSEAHKALYFLAPALALIPALTAFVVAPTYLGSEIALAGAAMALSSLFVVTNSLRLRSFR